MYVPISFTRNRAGAAKSRGEVAVVAVPKTVVVAMVRERGPRYEAEGSEARTHGSVSVDAGAWWSAALTVPMDASIALLRIERHGALPNGYVGSAEATDLSMPISEIDAVLTLLAGVVAQARREGVLRNRSSGGTL